METVSVDVMATKERAISHEVMERPDDAPASQVGALTGDLLLYSVREVKS